MAGLNVKGNMMAQAMIYHHTVDTPGFDFLEAFWKVFDWLATWTERHVPPGDDGRHLPLSVRSILRSGAYHI